MGCKRVVSATIVFIVLLLELLFVNTESSSYKCKDVLLEFHCNTAEYSHTEHYIGEAYNIIVPAGPGKNGIKKGTCQECGKSIYAVYKCLHKETHKKVTKKPTETETGEEVTICNECNTVLSTRELPQKERRQENVNKPTSPADYKYETENKENIVANENNSSLGNNMIYIPQAGIRKEFTQGSLTQGDVDASDILYSYAYEMGLGENDPFILGHNTRSMGTLKNTRVGSYIYLNVNGNQETYQVVISELAQATADQVDIIGISSGRSIYTNLGVKTLHLYTCDYSVANGRWMVLAKKI